jgi:hypothetical protein
VRFVLKLIAYGYGSVSTTDDITGERKNLFLGAEGTMQELRFLCLVPRSSWCCGYWRMLFHLVILRSSVVALMTVPNRLSHHTCHHHSIARMARRQQCRVHTLDPSYSKHKTRYGMSMEENPPSTSSFDAKDPTLNDLSMEEFSLNTAESTDQSSTTTTITSKRALLSFAIPALGIYLTNPLLSNMDNAFVGQTIGTTGLAALSPATICIDQMLYLFNFLSRATTGLVARAYDDDTDHDDSNRNTPPSPQQPRPMLDGDEPGNTSAARDAASARTYSTKHHFVCVLLCRA